MPPEAGPEAVLITGPYGSGKSSVAAEIADMLEKAGDRYAYLDLDHLVWGYPGGGGGAERRMLLRNLGAVASNFRAVGVLRFVLAGFVADARELNEQRAALDMPVRIVRLTLPVEEIERRLTSDLTSGRKDDLGKVSEQLERLEDQHLEHLIVANDRPVSDVALEILDWLGWT
jgi:adenylylsulfate kinase-like enzyme